MTSEGKEMDSVCYVWQMQGKCMDNPSLPAN